MIFYRLLSVILLPFLVIYVLLRIFNGKEEKLRIRERFGFSGVKKISSKVIWMHAVSVGEANSVLILLDDLLTKNPQSCILFTTTTITSAKIIAEVINTKQLYKERVIHQFLPLDSYLCVKKFLNYWQPHLALFIESEIWPNLLYETKKSGARLVLINGRMSTKSTRKWHFAKKLGFNIFDNFDVIFAQSSSSQINFSTLYAGKVLYFGNLKSQIAELKHNPKDLIALKKQLANRPFWLASSTHLGEEEIIFATHQELKQNFANILTILVPRHPNRAASILEKAKNLQVAQRSLSQSITATTDIYLADTMNELGLFYRLCKTTLICGSLVDNIGGHTPFEAAKLGCFIISGKFIANNKEAYEALLALHGCIIVENQQDLQNLLKNIFLNTENFAPIAENAKKYTELQNSIVARIINEIHQ